MDAISFVLGIKSSQLRSSQLRDLVYRGRVMKTSKIQDDGTAAPATNGHTNGVEEGDEGEASQRASRGDPKTAWVMAVYEDDAGDEQKWKRTITSSGSSEYRINDRVVTAQQYNEALEAENILIKARNFLVFQGDVEAIAAQNPKQLTHMIEQISGSLEYKEEFEKLQAEEEEAIEQQNFQLQRRRGINSEMKQYLEQKREAENYQKKEEERDDAIINHILWKLYHFQQEMDESSAQIQEHQEHLKEFRRNVETYEKRVEAARKEQSSVVREVNKIERGIKAKEKSVEDRENSLIPIDEKIAQSKKDMGELRKRIADVKKDRETQVATVQNLRKNLATVEKAQQQFEKEWAETLKKQGKELTDDDRKEFTALQAEAMRKTAENQSKLDSLERQLRSDEVSVNSLQGNVEHLTSTVEKLEAEVDTVKSRRDTCQEAVERLSGEVDTKKKQLGKVQSEKSRVNLKYLEVEDKLKAVVDKLQEAENGRRQSEREQRTQAMIRSMKSLFPGVYGRVGNLVKPTHRKYEEAVATAMGVNFDAVVVDTEKTGMDCIQYLKSERFSSMTFIPLDNIKVNASNSAVKGIQGARPTLDCLNFEPKLERAITYACEGSVVCDNLTICKDIVYGRRIPVKAVSLDGAVIHKSGTMTVGRVPEDRGGKRRFDEPDIENLRQLAEKHRDELNRLPRPGAQANVENELKHELNLLEQGLEQHKRELVAFNRNLQDKQKELAARERELSEFEPKYEEERAKLERTQVTVEKFRNAITEVQNKIFAGFCKRLGYENIQAYQEQQGSLEETANKKRQDFKVQKEKIENRLNWEQQQLDALSTRIKTMTDAMSRHHRDVEAFEEEKAEIEKALGEDQDELEALQETLEEARGRLGEKSKTVTEAKRDLDKRKKDIDSKLRDVSTLEAKIQKQSSGKLALLRRCKLEQIQIPLIEGALDNIPNEDVLLQKDQDAMDIDEEDEDAEAEVLEAALDDYGIEIDFDKLDEDLKSVRPSPYCSHFDSKLTNPSPMNPQSKTDSRRKSPPSRASSRNSTPTCAPLSVSKSSENASRRPRRNLKLRAPRSRPPAKSSIRSRRSVTSCSKRRFPTSRSTSSTYTRSSLAPMRTRSVVRRISMSRRTPTPPFCRAQSTPPCRRSSASAIWSTCRVARRPWQRWRFYLPSIAISRVRFSCSMRLMRRWIMRMWVRSRSTSGSTPGRVCSLLSSRSSRACSRIARVWLVYIGIRM